MELFKTTGVLDETVLKEVSKAGISKFERLLPVIYFAGSIALMLADSRILASVFLLFGLFLVLWQQVLFKRITINKNLSCMQELNGVAGYEYTTWLDDEGVAVVNLTNHAEGKIRYGYLKRVFETEQILVLQTKKKQFVPIFKSGLTREEVEEAAAFLREKNRKIKIERLKRQRP